jgi:hypothetical protein
MTGTLVEMGSLEIFLGAGLLTAISTSQVASVTGMSHYTQIRSSFLIFLNHFFSTQEVDAGGSQV